MNIRIFCLIIFEVFLNVSAQLSLKIGMERIGKFDFVWGNAAPIMLQVLLSGWFWLGICIYVVSIIIWLMILSRTEVSIAYPLISLGYVLNALAAYYLLHEHVTSLRLLGIVVILFGVFLVARS